MRLSNAMVRQINDWVEQDKLVIEIEKQLTELRRQRGELFNQCYKQGVAEFWPIARKIKAQASNLSVGSPERKQRVAELLLNLNNVRIERDRQFSKKRGVLNVKIERALLNLGRRRGILRKKFEASFVLMAQREMLKRKRLDNLTLPQ